MAIYPVLHAGIARLKPLAKVLAGILVVFAFVELAGSILFRVRPDLLWMQGWQNPDEKQRITAQVAAAEQILTTGTRPVQCILVTGLSTAREGIDNSLLGDALGLQVLNFGSSGGSFQELDYYTLCLTRTELRPSFIVLGVHASWLAGRMPPSSMPAHGLVPSSTRASLRKRFFLLNQFRRIHNSLQNLLLAGRDHLDMRLGFGLGVRQFHSPLDPFETTHLYGQGRANTSFLFQQLEAFKSIGWFNSDRYVASESESEANAFLRVLVRARRISPRVVVVLMPESEAFRNRIPPGAVPTLLKSMKGCAVDVLDARELLPESAFYDLVHANQIGRNQLSWWLANNLRLGYPSNRSGCSHRKSFSRNSMEMSYDQAPVLDSAPSLVFKEHEEAQIDMLLRING